MLESYQYKPLNKDMIEIRLLRHLKLVEGAEYGCEEQCVRASFEYTNLYFGDGAQEHTAYMALSYVWGTPNLTSAVILDDGTQIPISHNLLVAIQHLFEHGYTPVRLERYTYRDLLKSRSCHTLRTQCPYGSTPCVLIRLTTKKRAGKSGQ